MKLDRAIRVLIAAIVLLAFVIAVAALVFVTESALNVWARLVEGPRVLLWGYVAVLLLLVAAAAWLVIRLAELLMDLQDQAPQAGGEACPAGRQPHAR